GIFKRGKEFIGKTVGIAGEHLTGQQMAAALSRALGQEVKYNDVPADVYRSFGFPGADDVGNMFQFKRDFNEMYCGARNLDFARQLNPSLLTFDQWLVKYGSRIPTS
ncbi:MAG TPA: NmrA/HSCARG family protein, partial [Acidobacteriota bacterium]|nr:NmrA/HSCARG family protein [Acidobacteriota bacterium]